MNAKLFLDSNVLIYAYDNGDRSKQIRAQEILNRGLASNNIVHFIMRPKWHRRDNPLWLSCIPTGTGRSHSGTGG